MGPKASDGQLVQGGYRVFTKPNGDTFLMPPGGDPDIYVRKGFTKVLATPENTKVEIPLIPKDSKLFPDLRLSGPQAFVEVPGSPSKKKLPRVYDKCWAGQRCFILGGGPSLNDMDLKNLPTGRVIAINRAFEICPQADVVFSLDSRWYVWTSDGSLGEEVQQKLRDFPGIQVMMALDSTRYPIEVQRIRPYTNPNGISPSLEHGLGYGTNSGVAALNLALVLGCTEVYLLGFDCHSESSGGQKHFHNGYPAVQPSKVYRKFIASFNAIAEQAKTLARIVNVNKKSGLRCFDFGEMPWPEPLFVCCHTKNYREEVSRLMVGLDKFGLERVVAEVPSQGDWVKNCAHKAQFMWNVRQENPTRPLVWVDADATIENDPELFRTLQCDFAAHWLLGKELLSGTLFFGPTKAGNRLLDYWIKNNNDHPRRWDQVNLSNALGSWRGKQEVLPGEYCCIFDHPAHTSLVPVIKHWQASRTKDKKVMAL